MTGDHLLSFWIASGLSLVLMLVLRPVIRRGFGPRAQYLAWLLVPAFTGASYLPAPPIPFPVIPAAVAEGFGEMRGVAHRWVWQQSKHAWRWLPQTTEGAGAHTSFGSSTVPTPRYRVEDRVGPGSTFDLRFTVMGLALPLIAWLLGVLAIAAAVAIQHLRWRRKLSWDADARRWRLPDGFSPSVVGLLRPRLALPTDFERRFNAQERAGVLAHEAVHARRRDNFWNLAATGVWAINWFNPLAWWGLKAFQRDQELACDAAALAHADEATREAYRTALLKAFEISPSSALSSGWRSRHPLVERLHWVQVGLVERSWQATSVVLAAMLVGSTLAYALNGGAIWRLDSAEARIVKPGLALAALEVQVQINGGNWTAETEYTDVGLGAGARQIVTSAHTLGNRQVFWMISQVVREAGQPAQADVMVSEALEATGPGAPVAEVRQARFAPGSWQDMELTTHAGDRVRLRMRLAVNEASPAG